MKCIIFSDSHGDSRNMKEALRRNPDAEAVFFLGDGLSDLETVAERDGCRAYLPVMGNCDRSAVFSSTIVKKTDTICLEGQRIVYTHGDLYGAKYGIGGLLKLAGDTGASVVLFGHTHTPYQHYEDGLYLFNPGSISVGEFGIMLITDSGILLSHGKI